MEITTKKVKDLKPYPNNPRDHRAAVDAVANSIRDFGFKVPIIIDTDDVIVCGHTRLQAAKKLKMKEVPCIIADDLSEEQIKAFRLADNKVSELAEWDFDLLDEEIADIFEFDMDDYGFELFDPEEEHEKQQELTQERVENIENLGKAQFAGEGYYDIPALEPVTELPEITEWIGFNYVLSDTEPQGKAVHFFIDDYQFERVWNDPEKYAERLREYVCVATPDFSPYGDMPMALQIYNHYRKHWVGAYLQSQGVTVIPTIRASTNPKSFDWYLEGEPRGGIVIISSMWATTSEDVLKCFRREYETMYETLKPSKVFIYGRKIEGLPGNIEYVKSFAEKRFK